MNMNKIQKIQGEQGPTNWFGQYAIRWHQNEAIIYQYERGLVHVGFVLTNVYPAHQAQHDILPH